MTLTAHFTLDLEHDYAGVAPYEAYDAAHRGPQMKELADLVREYDIRLTVFATGKILEGQPRLVEFFAELGAEFELHSYSHELFPSDPAREVEKGLEAYVRTFGHTPRGYRSPGGVVSPTLFEVLETNGFAYDSSVVPSFRPGFYSNLSAPQVPYAIRDGSLVEVPMSVVPRVRLLMAASYVRLLGLGPYKVLLSSFGLPNPLVFLFHLVDLIPSTVRRDLPRHLQWAYAKGEGRGLQVFRNTLRYLVNQGYRSEFVSALVSTVRLRQARS